MNIQYNRIPSEKSPQTVCSRPIVEVRESERGDERETGEADGQASIGRRALLFDCLLPLRVRLGRDAFLLWGRNVRIDLYIPDGLQSVHAVKGTVSYSISISQSRARTSSH